MQPSSQNNSNSPGLIRGMGLGSATALNMIDMIGVGPFITMPLVLSAMGGPQAMLGWVVGALLAVCDGLVSAELGAAFPGSGGSYRYLSEIYGPRKWGRLISFLFIWQLSFSAPLSIASGCIGLAGYAAYYWPNLETVYAAHTAALPIPGAGSLQVSWIVTPGTALAIVICFFTVLLLYRRITVIGRLSKVLWLGVMGTIGWIIFAGLTHFNVCLLYTSRTICLCVLEPADHKSNRRFRCHIIIHAEFEIAFRVDKMHDGRLLEDGINRLRRVFVHIFPLDL